MQKFLLKIISDHIEKRKEQKLFPYVIPYRTLANKSKMERSELNINLNRLYMADEIDMYNAINDKMIFKNEKEIQLIERKYMIINL